MKRVVALLLIASVALFAAVAPQSDLKANAGTPRVRLPQFNLQVAPTPIEDAVNVRSMNDQTANAPALAVDTTVATVVYFEDFESGAPGWVQFDGSKPDPLAEWHLDDFGTGDSLWWCGEYDDGVYLSNWLVALETPPVIMDGPDSILSFDMEIACESPGGEDEGWDGWDGGIVQVSNDSGKTWTIMEPTGVPYNATSLYSFGNIWGWGQGIPGWGGEFGGEAEVNLVDYIGDTVIVRFVFASDGGYDGLDDPNLTGMYIDSINVAGNAVFNGSVADGVFSHSLNVERGAFWSVEERTDSLPSGTHVARNYIPGDTTYAKFLEDYFISPSITLPSEPATRIYCNFEFLSDCNDADAFPDREYWRIEVSPDDGETWNAISNILGDPDGANYVYSHYVPVWYDFQYAYGESCDLTVFANKTVKFRFYFRSDNDEPIGEGLMIDDFIVYTKPDLPAATGIASSLDDGDVVVTWDEKNTTTELTRSFLATSPADCGAYYGPARTLFAAPTYVGAGVGEEYNTGSLPMTFTSLDFALYPLNPSGDSISVVLYGLDSTGHVLYNSGPFVPAATTALQSIDISAEDITWTGAFMVMVYWESNGEYPAFYMNTSAAGGTMLLWGGAMYTTPYATPVGASGSYGDVTYSGLEYNVYRNVTTETTYDLLASNLTTTTYTDTSAALFTEYEYLVTVTANDDESILAGSEPIYVIPSDVEEQKYDDGIANTHFDLGLDTMVVVKLTPSSYPAKLEAVRFDARYTGDVYKIKIFKDNSGMPGDSWLMIEPPITAIQGWNSYKVVDMLTASGQNGVVLEEGESVWVGVKGGDNGAYPAWLGADTDGYSGMATMQIPGGGWTSIAPYLSCNPMIRGYFDTDIDMTGTDNILPADYKLAQNYPNPFNPATTIHFELSQAGATKIEVFDVAGRHVRTLLNSHVEAGAYDLNFDASALSSGVYFYRLTSGTFTDIKKMSLVK